MPRARTRKAWQSARGLIRTSRLHIAVLAQRHVREARNVDGGATVTKELGAAEENSDCALSFIRPKHGGFGGWELTGYFRQCARPHPVPLSIRARPGRTLEDLLPRPSGYRDTKAPRCAGRHNLSDQLGVHTDIALLLGGGKHVNQHHSSIPSTSAPGRLAGSQAGAGAGRNIAAQPDRCGAWDAIRSGTVG